MDDKKNKITIRISDETLRKCEEGMRISDCKVRNDFIERAIEFYSGYVSSQTHTDFLSDVILESMAGIVKTSENHLARMLFKIAVEMAKLESMLAAINDMDEETMRRLHIRCVNEVKKINGILTMEEAVRYQRSDEE
ncbi:hypothetical protein [Anaerotignum lactatifermentans]|uniref:hypothetical protein n=1 Tax=Anaerotignum lactatifermentans TaxID=160404 RepID=UPI00248E180E|nr:hypothetical protein [Anaerotignum lactatifermentans]